MRTHFTLGVNTLLKLTIDLSDPASRRYITNRPGQDQARLVSRRIHQAANIGSRILNDPRHHSPDVRVRRLNLHDTCRGTYDGSSEG